jgi:hypothetical protein
MKSFIFSLLSLALFHIGLQAQQLELLTENNKTSIRGLSVVNDRVVWVSGSNGTIGKSLDGGLHWEWMIVPGFEKRDFRDVEAFDSVNALIMAIAEPAAILKTNDGGHTWKVVFMDSTRGMFLDAMHFTNAQQGLVIGDPIDQKVFLATTDNGGNDWKKAESPPVMSEGEAFFAASGTNALLKSDINGKQYPLYVSGGKKSNLWTRNKCFAMDSTLMVQGIESTGANSVDMYDDSNGIIVGGDFSKDSSAKANCVLFSLSPPIHFIRPEIPPHGYRSCVAYMSPDKLICCGTSGVDISTDGGKQWKLISKNGFHVCQKAKNGQSVFLAGSYGRIAILKE